MEKAGGLANRAAKVAIIQPEFLCRVFDSYSIPAGVPELTEAHMLQLSIAEMIFRWVAPIHIFICAKRRGIEARFDLLLKGSLQASSPFMLCMPIPDCYLTI